jgi:glycosyltransferase involved in cell wall biosynthesis
MGKVSKYTAEGVEKLKGLLGASHLLILPTEAECAAVALAEANAYGVPFVSTDVGGNASLVQQNVNGTLLPLDSSVAQWADAAMHFLNERTSYERFCWQAYNYFQEKLTWQQAISNFDRAAHELLGTAVLSARAG